MCGVTKGPTQAQDSPSGGTMRLGKAVKEKGIAFRSWEKKAKQGLERKLEKEELKASYC